ncbi:MAG TPA: hypothetical protein VNX65_01665 [Patescibacteria group bacterium]|nr:hypothetical protein [Patescibacteria group bacterium]
MANPKKTFNLSDAEIAQTEQLLSRLEPGYIPHALFMEFYRLTPAPIMQIIPLRRDSNGDIEVLMIQRAPDEPFLPNIWHNPGTVLRANDTYETSVSRLLDDELQGVKVTKGPIFATNLFHQSPRGSEIVQLYWIEIDKPMYGTFWPLDKLPKYILESEIPVIHEAVKYYKNA